MCSNGGADAVFSAVAAESKKSVVTLLPDLPMPASKLLQSQSQSQGHSQSQSEGGDGDGDGNGGSGVTDQTKQGKLEREGEGATVATTQPQIQPQHHLRSQPQIGLDRRCAPLGNTFVNVPGELSHRTMSVGRCRSCPPHFSHFSETEAGPAGIVEEESHNTTATTLGCNCDGDGQSGGPCFDEHGAFRDREPMLARASTTLELESLHSSQSTLTHFSSASDLDVSASQSADAGGAVRCNDEARGRLGSGSRSGSGSKSASINTSTCDSNGANNDALALALAADRQDAVEMPAAAAHRDRGSIVAGQTRKTYADDPTTLMIRNLPHELRQQDLQREVDECGFAGSYDFLYLPTTVCTGMGKGYAFLNFRLPATALSFSQLWHRKARFGLPPGTLSVSPADVQGLQANLSLWDTEKNRRIRNPRFRPFLASDVAAGLGHAMTGSNSNGSAYSQNSTGSSSRSDRSNHGNNLYYGQNPNPANHSHHSHQSHSRHSRYPAQAKSERQPQPPQQLQCPPPPPPLPQADSKQQQKYQGLLLQPQPRLPQPQQRQYSWVVGRGGAAYAAPL